MGTKMVTNYARSGIKICTNSIRAVPVSFLLGFLEDEFGNVTIEVLVCNVA